MGMTIDLEAGSTLATTTATEQSASFEYRWSFIRKVYAIVAVQLLVTVAVSAVVVTYHPIVTFLTTTKGGLACYIVLLILPLILLCPLYCYSDLHPVNFILLGIFTLSLATAIGLSCAFVHGKVILEAAILTAVVVVTLTLFTFWGAYRDYDFSFLGPFLSAALMVLVISTLLQIFYPLGKIQTMIYGCIGSIIFCGYIVYDTFNLIDVYAYDEYILGAIALYLNILNLFVQLLQVLMEADDYDC